MPTAAAWGRGWWLPPKGSSPRWGLTPSPGPEGRSPHRGGGPSPYSAPPLLFVSPFPAEPSAPAHRLWKGLTNLAPATEALGKAGKPAKTSPSQGGNTTSRFGLGVAQAAAAERRLCEAG